MSLFKAHRCLACFFLLPDKTEATYRRLFAVIRQLRPNSRPSSCLVDFEKALQNSIVATFPEAKISECLFHLGQSLWRKICKIGERIRYNNDETFQLKIKCFAPLAFLPIDDVYDVFEELTRMMMFRWSSSLTLKPHTSEFFVEGVLGADEKHHSS